MCEKQSRGISAVWEGPVERKSLQFRGAGQMINSAGSRQTIRARSGRILKLRRKIYLEIITVGLFGNLVINLLSGLVGVVIGAFWTSHLQEKDRRARQAGAGRALLAEIQSNFRSLNDSPRYPRYPRDHFLYACSVWPSQAPLVAQLLDWESLEKVEAAYRYAPTASETATHE